MARRRKSLLSAVIGLSLGSYLAVHVFGGLPSQGISAAVPHGTLDCSQIESLWENEGGSASTAFMGAEIAMAESTGHEDATDYDKDGSVDRGLFQINSVHGSLSTYNVDANVKAAIYLSDDGTNWLDWVTYRTGAYIGQC
jgi:Lysozyme like domain